MPIEKDGNKIIVSAKGFKRVNEFESAEIMPETDLAIMSNAVLDDVAGIPTARKAWDSYNAYAAYTAIIDLSEVCLNSLAYLICVAGTKVQSFLDGATSWVSQRTGLTSNKLLNTAKYSDKIYATNGYDKPFTMDITNASQDLALSVPDMTNVVLAHNTGGSMAIGYYYYAFVYRDSSGNYSQASSYVSGFLDGSYDSMDISGIPTATGLKIDIYRSMVNDGTTLYYLTELVQGATTYTDTAIDSAFDITKTLASVEVDVPTSAFYPLVKNDRLFLANIVKTPYYPAFFPSNYIVGTIGLDIGTYSEVYSSGLLPSSTYKYAVTALLTDGTETALCVSTAYVTSALSGSIGNIVLHNAGSNYTPNDVLTVLGGTGGQVKVATVGGGGAVASVILYQYGTGYSNHINNDTTYGGAGTGCTIDIYINPYIKLPIGVNFKFSTFTSIASLEVYRTKANGSVFYRQKSIAIDGSATRSYNDTTSDGSLTVAYASPTSTTENSRIVWSENAELSTFLPLSFIAVFPDDGDAVAGLVEELDGITIFKTNSVCKLYTDPSAFSSGLPTGWQLRKIISDKGCSDPNSLVVTNDSVYFKHNNNIYKYTKGSSDAVLISTLFSATIDSITTVMRSYYDNNREWVCFPVLIGSSNYILIYDIKLECWYKFSIPFTSITSFCATTRVFGTDKDKIIVGGSTDGYLGYYNTSLTGTDAYPSSTNITVQIRTKTFSLPSGVPLVRPRHIWINEEVSASASIVHTLGFPDSGLSITSTESVSTAVTQVKKIVTDSMSTTGGSRVTSCNKFYYDITGTKWLQFIGLQFDGIVLNRGRR